MKNVPAKPLIFGLIAIIGGFSLLYNVFTANELIVLLNGLLVGSLVSIAVAYRTLLWEAIAGDIENYTRYKQMTLSIFLQWLVIVIGVSSSIYIRAIDLPTTAFTLVAFARYLAIIAAILQVTSPDLGHGAFFGRDRKVLALSFGIGASVALFLIYVQGV
jgi:hypothetical protein